MKNIAFALACVSVSIVACSSKPSTVAETESSSLGDVHVIYAPPVAETKSPSPCPDDMVLVDGDYCPHAEEICLYNVDINGVRKKGPANDLWSCGEYKYPTRCLSETRVHMRYCIDKYEWPNKEGQVPQDWLTWYDAKRLATAAGKRLCTSHEWTLAAEGPDLHPLPYGDGYHRDKTKCNFDRKYTEVTQTDMFKALGLHGINVMLSKRPDDKESRALRMFLVPSGSMPDCVSDYGVHDMSGNIDEWVVNEASILMACPPEIIAKNQCMNLSYHSGLMGGHVWHVRNNGFSMTTAHYPGFGWYETGARFCLSL